MGKKDRGKGNRKVEPANKHLLWKVLNGKESERGKVRWGVVWGSALGLDLGLSE